MSTGQDLEVEEVKDHEICSRHFPEGKRDCIPSIIPLVRIGKVTWPGFPTLRRCLSGKSFEGANEQPVEEVTVEVEDPESPPTTMKKKLVQELLQLSPPAEVGIHYTLAYT